MMLEKHIEQLMAIAREDAGLGVLIGVGAIVVGYLVYCIVPADHFPRTAGLLAANAFVGGLAHYGLPVAGELLFCSLGLSLVLLFMAAGND